MTSYWRISQTRCRAITKCICCLSSLIICIYIWSESYEIPSTCVNPRTTLQALYLSIVLFVSYDITYTHLVLIGFAPSQSLVTLVKTTYFSRWTLSLTLAFAHFPASGERRACSSIAWSESVPLACIFTYVFSVAFRSLVKNRLQTLSSHFRAVRHFFLYTGSGSGIGLASVDVSFCDRGSISTCEVPRFSLTSSHTSSDLICNSFWKAVEFFMILNDLEVFITWYMPNVVVYATIYRSHDRHTS